MPYDPVIEQTMRQFYGTLSEKDKRRYAAVEAVKLGRGGITYIAQVLGCHRHTVANGIVELRELPDQTGYDPRIRRPGAGRKRYDETYPDIDAKFLEVLRDHTAGDPMDEQVLWTDLTPDEIADRLAERHGIRVSKTVTRQLLEKHNYRRRKAQKNAQ
jgi:transposase